MTLAPGRSGSHAELVRLRCVSTPCPSQDAEEVARENALDVGHGPAPAEEDVGKPGHVGDGLHLAGGLFVAERAIEVGADADVSGGAGNLGDVVGVVGDVMKAGAGGLGGALAAHPAGDDHPCVECEPDDGVALREEAKVIVG